MAIAKHRADAAKQIDDYIDSMPDWSREICKSLRDIILRSDPGLIEDWKWGPNYYLDGMVCGFAAFHKHVNLVFFQGAALSDPYRILIANPGTLHNRHIRIASMREIKEDIFLEYILEAIDNNKNGLKRKPQSDKTLKIGQDVAKEFRSAGVFGYFNSLSYSHKKEYLKHIEEAKKQETRQRRIVKTISMLRSKEMLNDKYKSNTNRVKK